MYWMLRIYVHMGEYVWCIYFVMICKPQLKNTL